MRKILLSMLLCCTSSMMAQQESYRNLFVEMGYEPSAVEAKLQTVFNDVFHGPNKVYFEVGDTLGYISDIKNHDARTEGMSYGMMIAVQLDKKDIFDRLWRWSKKYMQHQSGQREGYFAWSCKTDGTHNAEGAASDGELYFITSLLFASNRWGNNTGINYKAEAQHILDCIQPRETQPQPLPRREGLGMGPRGPQKMFLIDPETRLITFTPDGFGQRFTDPSYHIPAFYEVWARYADDGRADYWRDCAAKSREFLHKATDAKTGLNPDMCNYDGTLMQGFGGRRNGGSCFRYDSWRVPMNITLDYEWSGADRDWQRQYGERIQDFFYSQGIDTFVDQYHVDGTLPEDDEILQAGGFRKLRHSIGLVGTLAAASIMTQHDKRKAFVDALWNAKHEPFDDGYFDAYYDGLLRLFAFMHLSGRYRVIHPQKPRLVVCTDIAPADVEPDDMESMVRLMAYADSYEMEALITSVGWNCDPYPAEWKEYLTRVIEAYRKDVPRLMKRSGQTDFLPLTQENKSQLLGYWPSADYLAQRAVMGSVNGGIKAIGEGNDSPGSDLLIRLADEDDPRPIYVAAWGGANTLAQAIWRIKQTRSGDELKKFVRKFRLFTITDQDMAYNNRMNRAYSSHQWLRREFADDLQFVWDEGAWQEQCELGKRHWQQHKDNIQGHGALGSEYPNYKWGVEGDTPSFLYVMPNGLNDPDDPTQAGWAGYHERGISPDSLTTAWNSWQEPVRSISIGYKQRFYPDELNDFIARMQWAAEGQGNHNPQVVVTSPDQEAEHLPNDKSSRLRVKAGRQLHLDASQSSDPDGDALTFKWWQQPEIGGMLLTVGDADKSAAVIDIPADSQGKAFHIVCEVHDNGPFHLVAYRRVIVEVENSL